MTREHIQDLFTDLAEDVRPPALAQAAWARSRQVRRRRIAASAAAVALVAVVGAVGLTTGGGGHAGPAAVHPSPGESPPRGAVQKLPSPVPDRPQGWLPASFAPPADAPLLTDRPLDSVIALYEPPVTTEFGDTIPPVYAYGSRAGAPGWARMAVPLVWATDGANLSLPVRTTSLSPGNGDWAAFPQPGGLVLVRTATGVAHTVAVPGYQLEVAWLPDGRHVLVSGGGAGHLVDVVTGEVRPTPLDATDVVRLQGGGADTVTLTGAATDGGHLTIRRYSDEGVLRRAYDVDSSPVAPYGVSERYGPAARYGPRMAVPVYGHSENRFGDQYLALIDDATGAVRRMLALPADEPKGCCDVLIWMNPSEVLVAVANVGIVDWNADTGAVSRAAAWAGGVVSLASTGCDWSVEVGGVTSACTT